MDETDFQRAALDMNHRPALLAALRGDPFLADKARARLAKIQQAHDVSQLMDRDYISRATADTLRSMLALIDLDNTPPVVIREGNGI